MLNAVAALLGEKYAFFVIQCAVLVVCSQARFVWKHPMGASPLIIPLQWAVAIGLIKSLGIHSGRERHALALIHKAYFRAKKDGPLDPTCQTYQTLARKLRDINVRRVAIPRNLLTEYLHFCLVQDVLVSLLLVALACAHSTQLTLLWQTALVEEVLLRTWTFFSFRQNRLNGGRLAFLTCLSLPTQLWTLSRGLSLANQLGTREEQLAAAFGIWLTVESLDFVACSPLVVRARHVLYTLLRS